jgi:AraC family transcriptional regulator
MGGEAALCCTWEHRKVPGDSCASHPGTPDPRDRTIALIAQASSTTPRLIVRGRTGASFSIWPFASGAITVEPLPYHVLAYLRHGAPTVTRTANGRSICKRVQRGSVTLVPQGMPTRWLVEGAGECAQVHVAPETVRALAEDEFGHAGAPAISDFFAIHDPWLAGYFEMLISEYDMFANEAAAAPARLVTETQNALLRHLLRWHSSASGAELEAEVAARSVNPLRSFLLHRIMAYVDGNIGCDISLRALADLAAMSTEHFLRSFRNATGQTPYQYVLEQRLSKAALTLKTTEKPIGVVAAECGFKTPNHFSAQFRARLGVRPSDYRHAHQRSS